MIDVLLAENLPSVYFVGKAGAGKTYSANYLKETYRYVQSKFAYPVYNLAYNYFDMKGKDRGLLQLIGTDIGRKHIRDSIWVDRFKEDVRIVQETYQKLHGENIRFVSDDVRFPNEHQALKDMGWLGIYLDTPDEIRIRRLTGRDGDAQVNTLNHCSETSIDLFKHELIHVDSSGTLQETYANIEQVLKGFVGGK